MEEFIELVRKTEKPVRILVCGGRDFTDKDKVFRTLNRLTSVDQENQLGLPVAIIHGGARGADALAVQWAVLNWQSIIMYKADWGRWKKFAGPIRNEKMLREGQPHLVVAFPGGRGTSHMVRIAEETGVPVLKIT